MSNFQNNYNVIFDNFPINTYLVDIMYSRLASLYLYVAVKDVAKPIIYSTLKYYESLKDPKDDYDAANEK